ncbi:MAG TPA: hypothetical protein VJV74_12075 [Terriglobia bacterium]|nr:hypothetical protein [Terriglobia bacterium]
MKKLMTLLSTVALAGVMSVPMFAAKSAKSTKPVKVSQTMAAQATSKGKAHTRHSKKHGTKAGKKMGQQNASPAKK